MSFSDPVALFHSALDAMNAGDWLAAAHHCDPVSLRAFQRQIIAQFAPPALEYEITPELLMQHEPNMPREAAEYQVSLHRMHRDPSTRLRWELPGIETIEQLATGEPAALFASWLLGRSPRTQILRLIELGHAPAAAAPLAGSGLGDRYYRFVVLGVVPDGEYAAHVVYRDEADETTPWPGDAGAHLATLPADEQQLTRQLMARSHARLAFCRREPDHSWLLVADHQFMGVESTSIASIAVNDGVPESSPDALST